MPLKDKLKRVGQRVFAAILLEGEKEVIAFTRNYMVGRLKRVNAGKLAGSINENVRMWTSLPPGYKRLLGNMGRSSAVREAFKKYKTQMNYEICVDWLRQDRPDLYSVFVNWPDGKARTWLSSNMGSIINEFEKVISSPPPPTGTLTLLTPEEAVQVQQQEEHEGMII